VPGRLVSKIRDFAAACKKPLRVFYNSHTVFISQQLFSLRKKLILLPMYLISALPGTYLREKESFSGVSCRVGGGRPGKV
jgi:hypothetical protein